MSGYSKIESVDPKSDHVVVDLQTPNPKQQQEPEPKPESKINGPEDVAAQNPRLSRNRSVASGHVVKMALSMRRSSSVSERYCRIHDQNSATWPFPFQEDVEEEEEKDGEDKEKKKEEKKKKRSKFLKACKRFFGLS